MDLLFVNRRLSALQDCKCNGGFQLEKNSVTNKLSCVRMASVNRTVSAVEKVSEALAKACPLTC